MLCSSRRPRLSRLSFILSSGATRWKSFPALKLVATRSTGYDHIDTRYCAEHSITVSNLPTYGENTVAENVFALLLAISHRLPQAMERARSGRFALMGWKVSTFRARRWV